MLSENYISGTNVHVVIDVVSVMAAYAAITLTTSILVLEQTEFIGGDKHMTTHRVLLGNEYTYKWNTVSILKTIFDFTVTS